MKNNFCRRPSCQQPTSGLEIRHHVNTRIPRDDHHPPSEQPGLGCTWLVQTVPFALYALEPHEDTPRQASQEVALLLVQTMQRQVPPLVEDQTVAQAQ